MNCHWLALFQTHKKLTQMTDAVAIPWRQAQGRHYTVWVSATSI
jgi:hypothetical protein